MTDTKKSGVAILGIFAVDVTFLAPRLPAIGETLAGSGFVMGPGGKGSNQAVAAARAGADLSRQLHPAIVYGPSSSSEGQRLYYLVRWLCWRMSCW